MQKPEDLFQRYIWLVNTFLQASNGITLKELDSKWRSSQFCDGRPLSRTTFNRYREVIEEMFDIIIDCEKHHQSVYRIANPEVLRANNMQSWMLRTLTVGNALKTSMELHERILLEDIPSGQEYLQDIIDAMKRNHMIRITYNRSFDTQHTLVLKPYCLKVFRQRWYVVGQNTEYREGNIRVYALDRILTMSETDRIFAVPSNFHPESFFKNDFGVYTGGEEPVETITIRAYGKLPDFLRTLPLHHSQQEVVSTSKYTDFSYHLRPTYDFRQELLSQADELEVLSPESFRQEFGAILRKAARKHRTATSPTPQEE